MIENYKVKNYKSIRWTVLLAGIAVVSTLVYAQTALRITIIGDSTVCNYAASKYPQTGWGQVLGLFFNSGSVIINNKAIGGRSTRNFYQEGRWTEIVPTLQKGEYVFIQFGHNDRDYNKAERYTDTTDYKEYLRKYVNESRAKGAIPVLISPMNMNAWNGSSVREVFCEGANNYRGAMMNVVKELTVPFIDLEKKSVALQKRMGADYCAKFIYLGLEAKEYPNYPDGVSDGTHFQEMGANFMAKFVCEGINELKSNADMAKLAAQLKPQFKVNVIKGKSITGTATESGNTFPESASVTIKIRLASADKFTAWYESTGKKVSTVPLYTFCMKTADITLTPDQPTTGIRKKTPVTRNMEIDYAANTLILNQVSSFVSIDIYSLAGKKILTKKIAPEPNAGLIRVPVESLSEGSYIVRVTGNNLKSVSTFTMFVNRL
ncbi:MAG TPA: SGNH/GDSL hydrolase family protein [Chitinispirillaceae bacterium]|nr:SGNH/GDSL hydrolase family protein [Chitinispirillaceae bacterium]